MFFLCYEYMDILFVNVILLIVMGRVENGWLCIRAVSFVIIYIDLMHKHPFLTLPVAISRQCCIDKQNIHNTNNVCVHRMCVIIC